MKFTELEYKGEKYQCRILSDSNGDELIIAPTSLLDKVYPFNEIKGDCFYPDEEAEAIDESIFYYETPKVLSDFTDKELLKEMIVANPDFFDIFCGDTYYQVEVQDADGNWNIPDALFSFQIFATEEDAKKWIQQNLSDVTVTRVQSYSIEDIEEPTLIVVEP